MTVLGVSAVTVMALVSSGTAYADTVLPGSLGSYSVSASSAGLYLAIAGNQLTGGTSDAKGTYSSTTAGSQSETAKADGQGFLLSTQITGNPASASVDNSAAPYTQSATSGKNGDPVNPTGGVAGDVGGPSSPPDCAQGGGSVQSGVGLALGLGCGYATATVDSPSAAPPAGPQALGMGNIASLTVDLQGILNQVYTGGASQLCNGLAGIPQLGQLLGDTCTHILASMNPSVQVNVGNAYSEVVSTATTVFAKAHSSSVDVSVFPGLDNLVEPLLRVEIPSATAESCEGAGCTAPASACTSADTSTGWHNWYDSALIKITGVLVDDLHVLSSNGIPDPIEIPSCGQANALVNAINGSPLGALLNLQLASASTSGSGVAGSGLQIELLPTQGPGGTPVLNLNGAGIQTSNNGTGPAATSPGGSPPQQNNTGPVQTGVATSPTSVHTGEWWAGSLPLLAVLAALGGGLIAWPRLRRAPMVARLVSRASR